MDELLMTILCAAFFVFTTFIFFASHLLFGQRSRINGSGSHSLPPGSMGLPFLGESIAFIRAMAKGRPELFVQDRIKRYSSETFHTSVLGEPTTIMFGPAGNKFLFTNEAKRVKVWWPKQVDLLLLPRTNAHKFMVKDFAHLLFKPDGLQKHFDIIDRMAKQHMETCWEGQQQVKVHPLAENFAFALACELFLSITDIETIKSLEIPMISVRRGFSSLPINLPWTQFGKAKRASTLIIERLKPIIQRRRALKLSSPDDQQDDLITHMLRATNNSGEYMNDDDMADWLKAFLVASHDTSSATIALVFNFLADHKDIYDKVLQEQLEVAANKAPGEVVLNWDDTRKMKYTWNVVCEVMRLYPPGFVIYRIATDDFVYDGYSIPKGSKIQVNIISTHRDPRLFPDPHKFDPSRFEENGPQPYTFIPFGGGSRKCPGTHYARAVILVYLHNAIIRFRWEKVDVKEAFIYQATPMPVNGLPIYLYPL